MMKALLLILTLASTVAYSQINRPQEPKAPFSYHSEDVTFKNEIDNVTLAGTFTYPKEGANFPVVVLISGSGPQNRDSEIAGHKPFLVIADYLTKNGIAVLRVDDRGTAKSEGNYNQTSLEGFARDTESALNYLASRKEINAAKMGLVGHSLGGVIAPMVASRSKEVAFIVLLSGSGLRGDKLMLLQKEKMERKMSAPENVIAMGQQNMKGAYDLILNSEDLGRLRVDLKSYFTDVFGAALPENYIDKLSEQFSSPWLSDFIKFDPETALSETKCPVLALNGTNDLQVPAKENLEAIEGILKANGNTEVQAIALERLNHLFQESKTGLLNEYEIIEQTFAPEALKIIGNWILKR